MTHNSFGLQPDMSLLVASPAKFKEYLKREHFPGGCAKVTSGWEPLRELSIPVLDAIRLSFRHVIRLSVFHIMLTIDSILRHDLH
jgi:hypothetical protein